VGEKLFEAKEGVCGGEPCVAGHRLKYETLYDLVMGGVSDAEIVRIYEFVTPAHIQAVRESRNAIACRYCRAESLRGHHFVSHTCEALKGASGLGALIAVDGGKALQQACDWRRR
jgi:uncharacterized protein (DUF433 family)